jgi:hypothetical protein
MLILSLSFMVLLWTTGPIAGYIMPGLFLRPIGKNRRDSLTMSGYGAVRNSIKLLGSVLSEGTPRYKV